MMKPIIYTMPGCSACISLKEFLEGNNISFTEVNVVDSEDEFLKVVRKTGRNCVPQIVLRDEVVVGFNQDRMSEALGL